MSGLLRRLTRRRAATADEAQPTAPESSEPAAAPAETPAEPGGVQPVSDHGQPGSEQPTQLIPATGEQPAAEPPATADEEVEKATGEEPATAAPAPATSEEAPATTGGEAGGQLVPTSAPQPAPARDLPAGVDPAELETAPVASARRGKMRRRLRYLGRLRELLLRDLGGFSYELQRTAGGVVRESHRRLLETKTGRLAAIDAEVRDLEVRLHKPHAEPVLRVPGVGGTCPECGELHSSDARYCSHCGTPLDSKARAEREAAIRAAAQPATGAHPTPEPQPASVLWAAGPRPQAAAEPKEDHSATSDWLAESPKATAEPPPATGPEQPATTTSGEAAAEPAATTPSDEPAEKPGPTTVSGEPGATTPSGEPPATTPSDEPSAAETSKPSPGTEQPSSTEGDREPGPNGRVRSGDPLGTRGEQRP